MKHIKYIHTITPLLPLVIAVSGLSAAPLGTAFTYQGQLTDGGNPAAGSYELQFAVFDAASGPGQIGPTRTNTPVHVTNGLFTVTLDFGPGVFAGDARWLQIGVRTNGGGQPFQPLWPRQPLTPTPYALNAAAFSGPVADTQLPANLARLNADQIFTGAVTFSPASGMPFIIPPHFTNIVVTNLNAGNADTVDGKHASDFWQLGGNDVNANQEKLGTKANANWNPELWLITDGDVALRLQPNATSPNVVGGFKGNNAVGAAGATIGGGGQLNNVNLVTANFGTIGGGELNSVQGADSTISGGANHSILDNARYSSVGGGLSNVIETNADYSTIGGGADNRILASSDECTIGGGRNNKIQSGNLHSFIGGGKNNTIQPGDSYCVIGGGGQNIIRSNTMYGTIGGGSGNDIQPAASWTAIGGGSGNLIQGGASSATIGGGDANLILSNALYAVIPGGRSNLVGASYGFAAGRRAQATNDGAFVWADSTDADFTSTNVNEFAVRARGGVRFETGGAGLIVDGHSVSGGSSNGLAADSVFTTNLVDGAVTSAKIADGTITASDVNAASFSNVFWKMDGNVGTTNGHFVGTTDGQALDLRVNNLRALRLEPDPTSPNVIGGFAGNAAGAGVSGAAIGGGGQAVLPNVVNGSFGTIGGGSDNQALAMNATVGGGQGNHVSGFSSTIAGGNGNQIQNLANDSTIGGGLNQTIQNDAEYATIGGGTGNTIQNNADYSTISGGGGHMIGPNVQYGTVPGGRLNDVQGSYGFAAGRRAKANHQGAFVWADSTDADFASTANNQFLLRASGNVGINKANPASALDVNGTITATAFVGDGSGLTGLPGSSLAAGSVSNSHLAAAAVSSDKIAVGAVVKRLNGLTDDVLLAAGANLTLTTNGNQLTLAAAGGGGGGWSLTGDAGTAPPANFLGTTDNHPLELKVNSLRALRLEPGGISPNLVGGFWGNYAGAGVVGATVAGGGQNGLTNRATADFATVSGGEDNLAGASTATVSGGNQNQARGLASFVGGGQANQCWGDYSVVGGGLINNGVGSGNYAVIGGGYNNMTKAPYAAVVGGYSNSVQLNASYAALGGGQNNIILDGAQYATIPGGLWNSVSGSYGFAAGRRARANHQGSFVWADSSNFDFPSTAANAFSARCIGGARFVSAIDGAGNPTAGVQLPAGGNAWSVLSDRHAKEHFAPVDCRQVLSRLAALPLTTWNLKSQAASIRHIGPMAQDFAAAFSVGEDDRHISTSDADGVALAAIQGLNQKLEEQVKTKDVEIQELEQRVEKLEKLLTTLAQNGGGQ